MDLDLDILLPGDCLLYRPSSIFGRLIALKTWSQISHVEVFIGNKLNAASRDGIGVDLYDLRVDKLGYILRPNKSFNIHKSLDWFYKEAKGQEYDWKGILIFTLAVKQGNNQKMFCSEFATRFYRKGGLKIFSDNYNADRVAPSNFLLSPCFDMIYKDLDY